MYKPAKTRLRLSAPKDFIIAWCDCSVPKLSSSLAVSVLIFPVTPDMRYNKSPRSCTELKENKKAVVCRDLREKRMLQLPVSNPPVLVE
jgi:hypothetical protein